MATSFEITGLKETLQVFQDLENEIGDKKARSKVLIPSVKKAMKPVLNMAKTLAPKDTGLLERTLTIVARRPSNKDKKSKYINSSDSVIAIVTTKPIPKKLKKEMFESVGHLYEGKKQDNKEFNKARKKFYESKGFAYDARAVANEFGTSNRAAKPFMRVSLESQATQVSSALGQILKENIEKYRSKNL